MSPQSTRRVVVVTGGAGGIGAGIAETLGRSGAFVVTLDPNVSLDGATRSTTDGPTTAERIIAAGGSARAADLSVTDAAGVQRLFADLVAEHGSLDAVVNVAGISRPTGFGRGAEHDWRAVLDVHLKGYLTVLTAALPIMAAAGHGRIVGVTSGSGWRPANAGAYAAAKRAVAALTWRLGADPPPGVTINALSPIAATRMVTASLQGAPASDSDGGASTGGITLSGFPPPEALGPVGAYLASEQFSWCSGRVLFSAGAELALVSEPRVLEAVRTRPTGSLTATLAAVVPGALVPAEGSQATGGGATARFVDAFDLGDDAERSDPGRTCLVVADSPDIEAAVVDALHALGVTAATAPANTPDNDVFATVADRVADGAKRLGRLDAVVVAAGPFDDEAGGPSIPTWEQVLDAHRSLPARILADAAWMRAAAEHSVASGSPCRFVALVGAVDDGGRSRAQAATQLSRAALGATDERVPTVIVSCESSHPTDRDAAAALAAHLVVGDETHALSGGELCVGAGWLGLRSHPAPAATVSFGGPDVPHWVDDALRDVVGATALG